MLVRSGDRRQLNGMELRYDIMKLVVVEGSSGPVRPRPPTLSCARPLCRLLTFSTWLPVEQGCLTFFVR
jgi:hypothetical protein